MCSADAEGNSSRSSGVYAYAGQRASEAAACKPCLAARLHYPHPPARHFKGTVGVNACLRCAGQTLLFRRHGGALVINRRGLMAKAPSIHGRSASHAFAMSQGVCGCFESPAATCPPLFSRLHQGLNCRKATTPRWLIADGFGSGSLPIVTGSF